MSLRRISKHGIAFTDQPEQLQCGKVQDSVLRLLNCPLVLTSHTAENPGSNAEVISFTLHWQAGGQRRACA
jgi:hypothetical protein